MTPPETQSSNRDGAASFAAPLGSAFRVKLLQLWSFERICGKDWEGIWETQSLHDQGTDKERWTIRRAFVTGEGQTLNEQRHNLPTWLLLQSGRCLKLVETYTPNDRTEPLRDGRRE